jgi:hypothetical protein
MRNFFIQIAGFPLYQYPSTRWAFKKFFQIVAMLTGRDLVVAQARFSSRESEILGQLREKRFFFAKPEDFSLQFQQAQRRVMDAASRLIDDALEKLKVLKKYLLNLDLTKNSN